MVLSTANWSTSPVVLPPPTLHPSELTPSILCFDTISDNTRWPLPDFKTSLMTSPVVQWLRICLPGQVWSLVWEDSTWHRATKSMHHNYWTHVLQLLKSERPRACRQQERSSQWEAQATQRERSPLSLQLDESLYEATKTARSKKKKDILEMYFADILIVKF